MNKKVLLWVILRSGGGGGRPRHGASITRKKRPQRVGSRSSAAQVRREDVTSQVRAPGKINLHPGEGQRRHHGQDRPPVRGRKATG